MKRCACSPVSATHATTVQDGNSAHTGSFRYCDSGWRDNGLPLPRACKCVTVIVLCLVATVPSRCHGWRRSAERRWRRCHGPATASGWVMTPIGKPENSSHQRTGLRKERIIPRPRLAELVAVRREARSCRWKGRYDLRSAGDGARGPGGARRRPRKGGETVQQGCSVRAEAESRVSFALNSRRRRPLPC